MKGQFTFQLNLKSKRFHENIFSFKRDNSMSTPCYEFEHNIEFKKKCFPNLILFYFVQHLRFYF